MPILRSSQLGRKIGAAILATDSSRLLAWHRPDLSPCRPPFYTLWTNLVENGLRTTWMTPACRNSCGSKAETAFVKPYGRGRRSAARRAVVRQTRLRPDDAEPYAVPDFARSKSTSSDLSATTSQRRRSLRMERRAGSPRAPLLARPCAHGRAGRRPRKSGSALGNSRVKERL